MSGGAFDYQQYVLNDIADNRSDDRVSEEALCSQLRNHDPNALFPILYE